MLTRNVTYRPSDFAGKILLSTVDFSRKTKAFLKEKATEFTFDRSLFDPQLTLADFMTISDREISEITCYHIRRELSDFKCCLTLWLNKEVSTLQFTKNIPCPKRHLHKDEKPILIALLLAEKFFGGRRGIAFAKHLHLPRVYAETPEVQRRRNKRRLTIMPMQSFLIAS